MAKQQVLQSTFDPAPYPAGKAGTVLTAADLAGDTVTLASHLLGAQLCRRLADGSVLRLPLTELEAYDGPHDKACHASKGRTPRTDVMFGPAGVWYVYLCYGVHWMLNIVTGPVDYPAAVLVRGVGPVAGPGRVTKALQINKDLNGCAANPDAGLWLERGAAVPPAEVGSGPRVGIDYAGPEWRDKPWRFVWEINNR